MGREMKGNLNHVFMDSGQREFKIVDIFERRVEYGK